jgi:hypothetical protein
MSNWPPANDPAALIALARRVLPRVRRAGRLICGRSIVILSRRLPPSCWAAVLVVPGIGTDAEDPRAACPTAYGKSSVNLAFGDVLIAESVPEAQALV